MHDKISLTYVTQSSSPLAAFVDFSAASAWPILLSPSTAIRSQLHARRFPLPQNTSVHSALACPVATATRVPALDRYSEISHEEYRICYRHLRVRTTPAITSQQSGWTQD